MFAGQLSLVKQQISRLARRDEGEPETVRDIYRESGANYPGTRYAVQRYSNQKVATRYAIKQNSLYLVSPKNY
jgi:hypothetical protein